MQLQVSIKFFKIYLGSPILGRVTATARGANYGQPINSPSLMRGLSPTLYEQWLGP